MALQRIPLAKIRTDGGTQPRAQFSAALEVEYATALGNGAEFPEVVTYFDGTWFWLADGFHRVGAHKTVGRKEIMADVRPGSRRDAVLYSVGANAQHGARRTHDDIKRAVRTLLDDPEWAKWSDRQIAGACKVHPNTVGNHRRDTGASSQNVKIAERNGTAYEMSTANIGKPTLTREDLDRMEFGQGGRPQKPELKADDDAAVFSVRIERELIQEVTARAKDSGMSNAEWATLAFQEKLQRLPKKRKVA